ncbi:hypothetical protein [Streptomyces sp. NPDC005407]|uniref:hypothetical protein n=1 Tax=Streptomyces sp. NPDC005407 TaxID=3155340 RepID=UPI0033A5CE5A
MIDIAVITSIPHLGRLSALGSIDMALTHLVLDHPAYAEHFRSRSRAGVQVILDNSAYELEESTGAGMSASPVLHAAERIGAHVVVCQDVLFDGPATVSATQQFLKEAHKHSEGEAPYKFMAVPQGRTRQEWMSCYEQIVALQEIDVIGLSKLSVARSFEAPVAEARLECMAALLARDAPKPFHLLGGDRSLPWELARHQRMGHDEAENGGVRSNDSSFAFWYAAMDISVDSGGRARREAESKPDLVAGTLTDERLKHALVNVARLRRAAGLPEHNPSSEPGGVTWQPEQ